MSAPGEYLPASITGQSLRLIQGTLAVAAFVILRLAAPLVRIVLTAIGLLSILMALFFRIASSAPRSPFWLLVGFGFSCGFLLLVYEQLLRLLCERLGARCR